MSSLCIFILNHIYYIRQAPLIYSIWDLRFGCGQFCSICKKNIIKLPISRKFNIYICRQNSNKQIIEFHSWKGPWRAGSPPPTYRRKKKKWSQGVLIHWPVTQLTAREQGARPQTPWGVTEAKSCAFLMSHVLSWHRLAVLVCHSSQGENRVNWVCCVPEKLLTSIRESKTGNLWNFFIRSFSPRLPFLSVHM